MDKLDDLSAVKRLGRNLLADSWAIRLFVALAAFDLLFMLLVAAKAFDLIWFAPGIGNLMIAGQLVLVALVLVSAWQRYRNSALGSLALVASGLAAEKIFKFHSEFGMQMGDTILPNALDASAGVKLGALGFAFVFGMVSLAVLMIGWRRSDRKGRAALLLVGAGFVLMAGTSVAADAAAFLLKHVTNIHVFTLSRAEQGLELITVSALLALTVGVVRVGWRRQPILDAR
jgi:hypothetical protein